MNGNDKITLYPSNWLYNAGVVGFLRVLENYCKDIREFFEDNGNLKIEKKVIKEIFTSSCGKNPPLDKLSIWHWNYVYETFKWNYSSLKEFIISNLQQIEKGSNKDNIMKRIVDKNLDFENISFNEEINKIKEILKKFSNENKRDLAEEIADVLKKKEDFYIYRKAIGSLFSSGGFYQNLFNPSQFKKVEKFVEKFKYENIFYSVQNGQCYFCGSKSYKTYSVDFQFFSFLFPAQSFINTFWNCDIKNITRICTICLFLIVHAHLGLTKIAYDTEIFLNAPSFKLIWDLNKFVREILQEQKKYEIKKLLGISLLQWAIKRRVLLGAWTMMNIEVVIKKRVKINKSEWETIIDYFDLPYHITRILLDYEIADLINRIGEEKIFNLVLNGKFSEIEKANYFVLRALLRLKNNEELTDNDPVTKYVDSYKDKEHLSTISNLLPELYAKINKVLKEGGKI